MIFRLAFDILGAIFLSFIILPIMAIGMNKLGKYLENKFGKFGIPLDK